MSNASWENYGAYDKSLYPELWDGIVYAAAPCLGPTGTRLFDHGPYVGLSPLSGASNPATAWMLVEGRYCLDFAAGYGNQIRTTGPIPALGDLTFSLWTKMRTPTNDRFFISGTDSFGTIDLFCQEYLTGFIYGAAVAGSLLYNGDYSKDLSQWHCVTVVRRGASGLIYIDGTAGDPTSVTTNATPADTLYIGSNASTLSFDGQLDDIRIYNRALSDDEIRLLASSRGVAYQSRSRRVLYSLGVNDPSITGTASPTLGAATANATGGNISFPKIETTSSGNSGANATAHTVTLPTGIAAGDLLVVAFSNDGTATASVTTPASGWTQVFTQLASAADNQARLTVFQRKADGAEASTITVTTSASEGGAYACYRISGSVGVIEAGTATSGSSTSPDPPLLNPSGWDVEKTLWIAVAGWDGNVSASAYPTNYTLSQLTDRWANTNGNGVAMAARQNEVASEDPGAFTIGSEQWAANTLAVRPVVLVYGSAASTLGDAISELYGPAAPTLGAATANAIGGNISFPKIETTSTGNSGGNATSHVVTLPTGIVAGDLLLVAFCTDGTPTSSVTTPATGWTKRYFGVVASSYGYLNVFQRIADGSEASTITVTTTASEVSVYGCYRISGASGSSDYWGSSSGQSNTPDPVYFNPVDWGNERTLWIACLGWDDLFYGESIDRYVTGYPTNYSLGQITNRYWDGSEGNGIALAARQREFDSEDPGPFTMSSTVSFAVFTIAVRPAVVIYGSASSTLANATANIIGPIARTLANATCSASGKHGPTGTIARTLAAATSSATGVHGPNGTVSQSLADATATASGAETFTGTLSPTLADATSDATGTAESSEATGAIDATLGDATSEATGKLEFTGTSTQALADGTSDATGTLEFSGTSAEALADATADAIAFTGDGIQGAVNVTLSDATAEASGETPHIGMITATLADATGVATGSQLFTGTATPSTSNATSTATSSQTFTGNAATSLSNATSTANGSQTFTGTATPSLSAAISAASGTTIDTTTGTIATALSAATGTAAGAQSFTATSATSLAAATATASGTQTFTGTATPALSAATCTATGAETFTGTITRSLNAATSAATASQTFTGTITKALDSATSNAIGFTGAGIQGVVSVTLGAATATATGATPYIGPIGATLSTATSAASGLQTFTGTSTQSLSAATGSLAGTQTFTGTITRSLGNATSTALGAQAFTGTSTTSLTAATSTASGTTQSASSITSTLQPATGTASGTQTFTGTSARTLGAATATATGAIDFLSVAAGIAGPATASATGAQIFTGTIAVTRSSATALITGYVALFDQPADVTATGRVRSSDLTAKTKSSSYNAKRVQK